MCLFLDATLMSSSEISDLINELLLNLLANLSIILINYYNNIHDFYLFVLLNSICSAFCPITYPFN